MNDDLNPERPPDHPEDALSRALQELVDGRLSPAGERLRISSAETTPEEAAEIAKLTSHSSDWQRNFSSRLARTPHRPAHAAFSRAYLWAGAGLAASLIIGAVTMVSWQFANTPERLLAEAYSHSRSFDLRIPGAERSDVTPETHLRGGATGRESSYLLDARTRIERHLEKSPQDPHWLELEARADLLEEKFDPAIDILDRLLAAGPATPSLLVDNASAYFQRGLATGSENDRATALDHLRQADELAPGDTIVLFNEAVVMEDRGQYMNAVETWNRFLKFENDTRWLNEGRSRLQALKQKVNQLKTHQGRMDEHLASPQAMRSLAADPEALSAFDEELSSTLLPRLLRAAFPMRVAAIPAVPIPAAPTRGSPCTEDCLAARVLLYALADSLNRNHQDRWLLQLLPSDFSLPGKPPLNPNLTQAAEALAGAIDADVEGDYLTAQRYAHRAAQLFHSLSNPAGEDRAQVEESYALLRSNDLPACYRAAHPILSRDRNFAWIQILALTQDTVCDPTPGTASENNPAFQRAVSLAHDRRYTLLELRAWNLLGAAAVDSGDTEAAWRMYLPNIRRFYSGDYPAMRLYATLSGLAQVEQATPRTRHALLLQHEVVSVLELTESRQLMPTERLNLADAAIRAGALSEAKQQMELAQNELAANGGGKSVQGFLAETETDMATLYLDRHDFTAAAAVLDAAHNHMAGEDNSYHRRDYAVARGELDLVQGHPEAAEPLLRDAILEEEQLAGKPTAESIVLAQQDHDLYAVLAAVWLEMGRNPEEVLALWERYRLRILGTPPPPCSDKQLACLRPDLGLSLTYLGNGQVLGQIVVFDRLLRYRANAQGVAFSSTSIRRQDALAAAAPLELAVSSPETSIETVDQAARRAGELFLEPDLDSNAPGQPSASSTSTQLLLEPDPLLGNLPWPAVETANGPIGLHFNLDELPSLVLEGKAQGRASIRPSGKPLIVGASIASGQAQLLPEVLTEARAVARFSNAPNLLLAEQATQPEVAAHLGNASYLHFAGHAAQQDGATRLLLAQAIVGSSAGSGRPWLDSDLLRKHPPRAARLAVFSACSTGKKEEGWNHGMDDIVATMASLGVPDVVATRWQIDSASAVPMMNAFYRGLANGQTVPQALTGARQSLLRDSRYRHPYYWAAWYASGSGNADLRLLFNAAR